MGERSAGVSGCMAGRQHTDSASMRHVRSPHDANGGLERGVSHPDARARQETHRVLAQPAVQTRRERLFCTHARAVSAQIARAESDGRTASSHPGSARRIGRVSSSGRGSRTAYQRDMLVEGTLHTARALLDDVGRRLPSAPGDGMADTRNVSTPFAAPRVSHSPERTVDSTLR